MFGEESIFIMGSSNLGIMGGTFNPIHVGHLMIAEEARQQFNLSKVLFIPDSEPPHKDIDGATSAQRLIMTKLAIQDNPYFFVSDMEIKREGTTYTLDTMRAIKKQYGAEHELYFIAGTDTIQDLPNWHDPLALLQICHFIGAARPDGTEAIDNIIDYFGPMGTRIHKLEVPTMELSSTELRYRLRHGISVRYFIPPAVLQYIYDNEVYQ